jgi:hypothetical protein
VKTKKIEDNAVKTRKIAARAVTAAKLATSEPYHEVGTAGEPGFQSGWPNASSVFSSAAFYRDPLGVVHLKGFIQGSSVSLAFTLPPGYRPSKDLFLPAAGVGPEAANLQILDNGAVIPGCEGGGLCVAGIDGLAFRVP